MTDYLVFDGEPSSSALEAPANGVDRLAFDLAFMEIHTPADFLTIETPGKTTVTVSDAATEFLIFDGADADVTALDAANDFLIFDTAEPFTTTLQLDTGEDFIVITSSGPQGERGIPGPVDSSQGSHAHVQSIPLSTWDIFFDLPFMPSVMVVDSAGSVVGGNILIVGPGHYQLQFTAPFSGSAYLS